MIFVLAFLVGGGIAALGQLILDLTKLTPGHVLTMFTVAGGVAAGFGLYQPLVDVAGAGAMVPITSFGNALAQGAIAEAQRDGIVGVLSGVFELTSSGITAAIIFGFLTSLVFKPRG